MLSFCLFFSFKRLPWQPAQYSRLPPSIFWYPVVSLTYLAWWHNSIRKVFFKQIFDTLMPDCLIWGKKLTCVKFSGAFDGIIENT